MPDRRYFAGTIGVSAIGLVMIASAASPAVAQSELRWMEPPNPDFPRTFATGISGDGSTVSYWWEFGGCSWSEARGIYIHPPLQVEHAHDASVTALSTDGSLIVGSTN